MYAHKEDTEASHFTEKMFARVCREAGARVKFNAYQRDMIVNVRVADETRVGPRLAVLQRNPACSRHHPPWCLEKDEQPHPQTADVGTESCWTTQSSRRRGAVRWL